MENQLGAPASQPTVSSAMTRMSNVFSAPSDLYTEVATAPTQSSSWLIPFLVLILISILATYAVYNNPALRDAVFTMQEKGMRQAIEQGKMTEEQFERASEQMRGSGPVVFVLFGSGFQIVGLCVIFFLGALLLWLVVKVGLKSPAPYSKVLEIFGLSEWIGVLGAIITIILINLMNSITASPGGGLLLGDAFDQMNKSHRLLAALNIFSLWQTAVCGIGVAKLTGKSTTTGMIVSFGVWAFGVLLATFLF